MLDALKKAAVAVKDAYLKAFRKHKAATLFLTCLVVFLILAVLMGCACNPSNPPEAPSCDGGSCSV